MCQCVICDLFFTIILRLQHHSSQRGFNWLLRTMTSLVGLLSVGRIKMASMGTAPVCFVRSFWPLIQPLCWENSLSLMTIMSSPFLKLRSMGSSVKGWKKQLRKELVNSQEVTSEEEKPGLRPCFSTSFRATAYCERSVSPLRNMVMSSAMSSAMGPLRVKSPFSVSRHTAWPDLLLPLRTATEPQTGLQLSCPFWWNIQQVIKKKQVFYGTIFWCDFPSMFTAADLNLRVL